VPDHCRQILTRDQEKLQQVVDFLMEHETMSGGQFEACMKGEQIEQATGNAMFDFVTEESSEEETK